MFCRHCGATIDDNAKFCTNCGKPIAAVPKEQAPVAPAPATVPKTAPPASAASAPTPSKPAHAASAGPSYVSVTPRDRTGKYILKRAIFCAIGLILGVVLSLIIGNASPAFPGNSGSPGNIPPRIMATFFMLLASLIPALIAGMLAGLAKSNSAKNTVRIISAVLRSLAPFAFGLMIMYVLGSKLALFPIAANNSGGSYVMPILALFLPLAGYFMDAAVCNGHRETFGQGIAAVFAYAADKIIVIAVAETIVETVFKVPGLGMAAYYSIVQRSSSVIGFLIAYTVMVLILRFVFDLISAIAAKGDPAPLVYGPAREKKGVNGLLIAGIVLAGIMLILAIILPLSSGNDPVAIDISGKFLAPGKAGHLLGTDSVGRDFYTRLVYAFRNTFMISFINTVIGVIFSIIFGVLAGFLKGVGSEIFKGITYLFGHGTFFVLMLALLISGNPLMTVIIVGLFGWGTLAGRISGAIKAKRSSPGAKTSLMVPALTQVVNLFCSAALFTSGISMLGLGYYNPGFPTLGTLLAEGINFIMAYPRLVMWPALALIILLLGFYILHAGLASKERRSY